jgi:hypothetical protein
MTIETSFTGRRISRRAALRALAGGGIALGLAACSDQDEPEPQPTPSPTVGASPAAPSGASAGWQRLSPAGPQPDPRKDHSLTYDAAADTLYLFGGRAGGAALDDLWTFQASSGAWTRLQPPAPAPAARFGHNAAFDAARGRLVIFGGQAGSTFFNDAWAFDPRSGWKQIGAQAGPSPRYGAGGALDLDTGLFYISHGFTSQGRFDDTWRLALGEDAWRSASPSGGRPLARCLLRAVWHRGESALYLFGGQSNSAPYHNDLWRLDSSGWSELKTEPRPSPRNLYAADYDESAGRLLLFGGRSQDGNKADLWSFSEGGWSQLSVGDGPSARNGHDIAMMAESQSLFLFGGAGDQGELNDLWQLRLA